MFTLNLTLSAFLLGADPQATPLPTGADARRSVEKALPFIEKEGLAWMKERKCLSCHNGTFLLWSHHEARAKGIAVDDKKLAEWTDWSIRFSLSLRNWYKLNDASWKALKAADFPDEVAAKLKPLKDKGFSTEDAFIAELKKLLSGEELERHQPFLVKHAAQQPKGAENDGGGLDTMTQLLLVRYPAGAAQAEFNDGLRANLFKFQDANGSWKAAGQLPRQKRPAVESDSATTMWTLLALATLEDTPGAARNRGRALAWLKTAAPGDTNESILLHMLIENKLGDAAKAKELLKDLRARQNADGGWSWAKGKASDAFATGQSLYALDRMGAKDADPVVRRAWKFLLDTQQADGSWVVPSSVASSTPNKGRDAIYNFWGSAWAVIGLARSLPPQ